MGKFNLEVGLVSGDEHSCHSCCLREKIDHLRSQCFLLRVNKTTGETYKEILALDERGKTVRPPSCPLLPVDKWESEK